MSKQLVANGNDLVVGIATPAAQGLASATKDLPVIMAAITDPIGANLVKDLKNQAATLQGCLTTIQLNNKLNSLRLLHQM